MPRDNTGGYSLPPGYLATPGDNILASQHNLPLEDLASEMSASIPRSGAAPMVGPLTLAGLPTENNHAASKQYVDSSISNSVSPILGGMQATSVGGTADAITLGFTPAITAYTTSQRFRWVATGANTVANPTININGLGARTLVKLNGLPLVPGDIPGAGFIAEAVWNGTNMVLLNPAVISDNVITATSVGGTVNAIVLTLTPNPTAYTTGLKIKFTSAGTNTASNPTLAIGTLPAKPLKKADGTSYALLTFPPAGQTVVFTYDGVSFVGESLPFHTHEINNINSLEYRLSDAKNPSGQQGSALFFHARAFANINGTIATGTYVQSGGVTTVTMTAHGLATGEIVPLTLTPGGDITCQVTVTGVNTFTFTFPAVITSSGSVSRGVYIRNTQIGAVNSVVRNAVGDYTVSLAIDMPNLDYLVFDFCNSNPASLFFTRAVIQNKTINSFRITVKQSSNGTAVDSAQISLLVFG